MAGSYKFRRAVVFALAGGLVAYFPAPGLPVARSDQVQDAELDPRSPARKELLRLMEELEVKLPRELARMLIVISMKLSTGYCSPYAAKEFEDALAALPAGEIKPFEAEWKKVREHKHWPRMPKPQPAKTPPVSE